MKAVAVFPADRRVDVIDHPEPSIQGATEVKMRMLEVGICGTDKEIVTFHYGEPPDGSKYLVIGHESLAEVVDAARGVKNLKPGDLVVATVRRPCAVPTCVACRAGRQDFCSTGLYTERGIMRRHGFMTELVVEDEQYLNPVPNELRDVAVLVEPLTIAEKAIAQLWQIQQRLPWKKEGRHALVLGAGPVGLLGAMKLRLEGFETTVYSRTSRNQDALAKSIGANFVDAQTTDVPALAKEIGDVDVVYEAVGASALAFEVLRHLGSNGVFIFTGVPGQSGETPVDTDALMRNFVLKNQVVLGSVNAAPMHFHDAISDIGAFMQRWPSAVRSLITGKFPIEQAVGPLEGRSPGIKNVIEIAG